MAHQVPWNKVIVEEFITQALLSEDEEKIIRMRAAGWSRIKQADTIGMSVSNVDKITKRLKIKYDEIAKFDPILPPRERSTDETWKS